MQEYSVQWGVIFKAASIVCCVAIFAVLTSFLFGPFIFGDGYGSWAAAAPAAFWAIIFVSVMVIVGLIMGSIIILKKKISQRRFTHLTIFFLLSPPVLFIIWELFWIIVKNFTLP